MSDLHKVSGLAEAAEVGAYWPAKSEYPDGREGRAIGFLIAPGKWVIGQMPVDALRERGVDPDDEGAVLGVLSGIVAHLPQCDPSLNLTPA